MPSRRERGAVIKWIERLFVMLITLTWFGLTVLTVWSVIRLVW